MPLDRTLFNLDRVPTLTELKAFFKNHDWSSARITKPRTKDVEQAADMKEIKRIMNALLKRRLVKKVLQFRKQYLENKICFYGVDGNCLIIKAIRF